MDNEQIYGSTVATFAQNDLRPHTISGGHIPQCWMNVFSFYWSVPAIIGWHRMEWLFCSSKLVVFCIFAKTDLVQVQCLHNLRRHWPNNPKCNPLHVLPVWAQPINQALFLEGNVRRQCTHMLLLIKPILNHHMTGLMHCDTHKFLLHKQKTRY